MPEAVDSTGSLHADLDRDDYDEFQFLKSHATWAGLQWTGQPVVTRQALALDEGAISYLKWGTGSPELVMLHGAGQNAHTWDAFAMAAGRPSLAIDLPGHGRSDWRDDHLYTPDTNAAGVAAVVDQQAPEARAVIGMSWGGLATLRLATLRPALVRAVVIVDITPDRPDIGSDDNTPLELPGPISLIAGPRRYDSWTAMVDEVHASMPHRTRESLVPGLRHNAVRLESGAWGWRYDRLQPEGSPRPDHTFLWDDVERLEVPAMFVLGARSSIVSDAAVRELRSRLPAARFEVVVDAGHAVQSDRPVELARLIDDFLG